MKKILYISGNIEFFVGICFLLAHAECLKDFSGNRSIISFLGATLGTETFTDLDYADDVALLAEMLEVLLIHSFIQGRRPKQKSRGDVNQCRLCRA